MSYVAIKWLHVLSSTVLFRTGLGSAWYMLLASLTRDPKVAYHVVRHVVVADAIFTTTTIVFQPLSGLWLAHIAGYRLISNWLMWTYALYVLAGLCWLPVVWMQLQMRDMARDAMLGAAPLPPRYWRLLAIWAALGVPAFLALVAVFYLMIAKPA